MTAFTTPVMLCDARFEVGLEGFRPVVRSTWFPSKIQIPTRFPTLAFSLLHSIWRNVVWVAPWVLLAGSRLLPGFCPGPLPQRGYIRLAGWLAPFRYSQIHHQFVLTSSVLVVPHAGYLVKDRHVRDQASSTHQRMTSENFHTDASMTCGHG